LDPAQSNTLWRQNEGLVLPGNGATATDGPYYQMLIENMHDAVIFVDSSLRITLWSHGAQRLTGIAADAVVGRRWLPGLIKMLNDREMVIPDSDCPVAFAVANGVQLVRRHTINGRGGKKVQVNAHIMPVVSAAGVTKGAAVLLHDVSSETTLQEQIQNLNAKASQDALTKVANRAELDRGLANFIDQHLEKNFPCALILCDIDHFKKINDTYGHGVGDDVLRKVGKSIRAGCRPYDTACRFGGDEFGVILAQADIACGKQISERIIDGINELKIRAGSDKIEVSCSGGLAAATIMPSDFDPTDLLKAADEALYRAKSEGRYRLVVATPSG